MSNKQVSVARAVDAALLHIASIAELVAMLREMRDVVTAPLQQSKLADALDALLAEAEKRL